MTPTARQELERAWNDPGPHPSYHYAQKRRLRAAWPRLVGAIERILAEDPPLPPTRRVVGSCAVEVFAGEPVDLEQLYAEAFKTYEKQLRVGNHPMRVNVRVVVSGDVP